MTNDEYIQQLPTTVKLWDLAKNGHVPEGVDINSPKVAQLVKLARHTHTRPENPLPLYPTYDNTKRRARICLYCGYVVKYREWAVPIANQEICRDTFAALEEHVMKEHIWAR